MHKIIFTWLKNLNAIFLCLFLTSSLSFAQGVAVLDSATDIQTTTTEFGNNITSSANTVQKALKEINDLQLNTGGTSLCQTPNDASVCIVYANGISTFYVDGQPQWATPIDTLVSSGDYLISPIGDSILTPNGDNIIFGTITDVNTYLVTSSGNNIIGASGNIIAP